MDEEWCHRGSRIGARDSLPMPTPIGQKSDVTEVTECNPERCN